MKTKKCYKCKEEKPISCFHMDSSRHDGLKPLCKVCTKEYNRSDSYKISSKKYWSKYSQSTHGKDKRSLRTYGITSRERESVLYSSDSCQICGLLFIDGLHPQAPMSRNLDHCHTTGQIRGVLCGHCNRALGLLKDDPDILRKAADYIESFR